MVTQKILLTMLIVAVMMSVAPLFGHSADAVDEGDSSVLVPYAYTISRRDVEKKYGSLCDGKVDSGASWFTKWTQKTDVICELTERYTVDRMDICMAKNSKWYILKEIQVATDDGSGKFAAPKILQGFIRSPLDGPTRDASCTNHVFSISELGKAVRIKVTFETDASAMLGEIRIFGSPLLSPDAVRTPQAQTRSDIKARLAHLHKLENRHWRVAFEPLGGRVMSLYSKATEAELTDPAAGGSFEEEVWDRRRSRGFLRRQPFAMTYEEGAGGSFLAKAAGNAQGGGIDFLKVVKSYSSDDSSTALKVRYRFENIPEAMAMQNYAPLIRAALGVCGREVTCYYPTADGIVALAPGERGGEYWGHRPARGWMAVRTKDGAGAAVTMPYAELKTFYSEFSRLPTLEWRMIPLNLEAGSGYYVVTEIIPFRGLATVSGAGGGLVGSLDGGICTVVSSRAGEVAWEAGGKRGVVTFAAPGASVSFRTDATTVVLKRGDAEVCRLEARPSSGKWKLADAGARRDAIVAASEVDLTCYTNFPSTVCTPWAKPLPGRKLKVSVITGNGNQIEVGRLAERFDFDFKTAGVVLTGGNGKDRVFGNPRFQDGDHFSLVNTSDLERAVRKVLKFDSDVILIGGVPFEAFTKDLRDTLISRVKNGTALVWIGLDRSVPELGFKLKKTAFSREAPVSNTPEFQSVPFSLFGGEDVFAIDSPAESTVHASCSDRPYLLETKLGKGRVFHIAYRALTYPPWMAPGLTPANLSDFYETKTAPVEQYYSLIAKTLLAASGKELPVKFVSADISGDRAVFVVDSDASGATLWDWRVTDAFGDVTASGSHQVDLTAGRQKVELSRFAPSRRQGQLLLELSIRTRKGGVLNWGGWVFKHAPKAEISSLACDESWLREGESVSFTATVPGDFTGMRLKVSLVDSYGRTVAETNMAPAAASKGCFRIVNAMPARSYALEARLEDGSGSQHSRRRTELRVRPEEAKYAWNDFEIGIWASSNNREYLWPGLAEIYHRIGVSTVIANPPRIEKDFAMRYNLHPTLLSGAGLDRSAEPAEFSKTGDKMTLVRPTCLSDPEFFKKREKYLDSLVAELPRHGMRFVWFGDELSLTGYGGNAVDFCFSPHCLKEMRAFAKARYGTLERLNEAWESRFADWDSVVPFTRQEVWAANGRHVAGWADHLEFMDSRLTNSVAFSVRRIKAVDPAVRFALSGTQAPSAYGGTDWWKQLNVMDAALNYGYGGQYDIHRSFCPGGGFMSWKWGYARRGASAVEGVWSTVFYGMRGIMGFQSTSQINQDWTYSRGLADSLPHLRRIVEGVGIHFVGNLSPKSRVAVLYSQASLRAAFIEKRREEHDGVEEKMRMVLRNLGCAYDYISYDELASGVLSRRGYRVLMLADAVAMSDAEIDAVRAFAAQGGTVVAEGMPAVRMSNCRARRSSPLADLFSGGGRHTLFPKNDIRYLKAIQHLDRKENSLIVANERTRYCNALAGGGVFAPKLSILDEETSEPVMNVEIFTKSDGAGNQVWCVLAPYFETPREVLVRFPKKAWTYDLVSGRIYGKTDSLRLPLGLGVPYAFVQLPEKVELAPPSVSGARVSVAYTAPVDGAVYIEVFRPDGSQAYCYAKSLQLSGGAGAYEIPFALSDPRGRWKVRVSSIFGRSSRETVVEH